MSRQVAIKLRHDDDATMVSVDSFVRTLDAFQKAVKQIGEMHRQQSIWADTRPGRTPGRFKGSIDQACALRILDLELGSATAVLELPPQPQPELSSDSEDLGARSLDTAKNLVAELSNGASAVRIEQLLPLDNYRLSVLETIGKFCPTPSERMSVELWDPDTPSLVQNVHSDVRRRAQELRASGAENAIIEERRFIGRVDYVRRVVLGNTGLAIPIDPDSAGGYVPSPDEIFIVTALCRVIRHDDREDDVIGVVSIIELEGLDASPLEIAGIETGNGCIRLRSPLSVEMTVSEGALCFRYEPLGIVAHGESREEAEEALRDELSWFWEQYASANDDMLWEDLQEAKRHLLSLVGGGHDGV